MGTSGPKEREGICARGEKRREDKLGGGLSNGSGNWKLIGMTEGFWVHECEGPRSNVVH
jgi:hypothetical protein